MKKLNPKQRIPDSYRNQVIDKLEELNNKIKDIKSNLDCEDDRRSVYCYEVKWLLGNYKHTDINVACLYNDLSRIKGIIEKVDFWSNYPNNKYKKQYTEYFFLEDKEYYDYLKSNQQK